jgi:hypothetical protein
MDLSKLMPISDIRLQEELLSPRILAFVNGDVYFRCRKVECVEHGRGMGSSSLSARATGTHESFQQTIQTYSKRRLTFEGDRYRAVVGLVRQMSQDLKVGMIEGLPAPLENSLLFFRSSESTPWPRRPGFPSYSWIGWNFVPEWRLSLEYPAREYSSSKERLHKHLAIPATWYLKDKTGEYCEIGHLGDLTDARPHEVLNHHVFPALFRKQISQKQPHLNRLTKTERKIPYPLLCFWTLCFKTNLGKISNASRKYTATIRLDNPGFPLWRRVEIALILKEKFGSSTIIDPLYWGLILERKGAVSERRGIVAIQEKAFDLLPELYWKLVVLG